MEKASGGSFARTTRRTAEHDDGEGAGAKLRRFWDDLVGPQVGKIEDGQSSYWQWFYAPQG
jgi:hypothetical protein